MSSIDKATWRVVALVVLLVLAAFALRGYLPGSEPAPRERTTGSPAALVADVVLLGLSIAIVAFAIIVRSRNRRVVPAAGRAEWFRGRGRRSSRRALLFGLGLIVAYVVIVFLLARLFGPVRIDQPALETVPDAGGPTPDSGAAPPGSPASPSEGGNVLGYLVATTVMFVLLAAAATIVASRRQQRVAPPSAVADDDVQRSGPDARSESLVRAAELGLAEIGDLSREPREAIIACYATMERELAKVPGAVPQEFDTPSEVLARAVEHHALHADSATRLVGLFEEARFSPHVMNEGHRDIAVRTLQLVLSELRSIA